MAVVVSDSFNRPDGPLGNPDIGAPWQVIAGGPAITSGQLAINNGVCGINTGAANCVIQATNTLAADNAAIYFRIQNNDNVLRLRRSGTQLILQKKIATVSTNIAVLSANFPFANGDVWKIVCNGSTISCFINDVQVGASQTVTDLATMTLHGFGTFPSTSALFDNFTVDDAIPTGGTSIGGAGNITMVSTLGALGGLTRPARSVVAGIATAYTNGYRFASSPVRIPSVSTCRLSPTIGRAGALSILTRSVAEFTGALQRGTGSLMVSRGVYTATGAVLRGVFEEVTGRIGVSAPATVLRSGTWTEAVLTRVRGVPGIGRNGGSQTASAGFLTGTAASVFLPPSRNVVLLPPRLIQGVGLHPGLASEFDGTHQVIVVPGRRREITVVPLDTAFED